VTDERVHLATANVEVDVDERARTRKGLRQSFDSNDLPQVRPPSAISSPMIGGE
jgi:hypothetical protein